MDRIRISRINSVGITHCARDWSWDTTRRPPVDHDLWTVFAGSGELRTPDRRWPLLPGDCFILEPGGRYRGRHDPDHPLTVIHIHFDPAGDIPLAFHRRLAQLTFPRELLTRVVTAHREGRREEAIQWLEAAFVEIRSQERLAERVRGNEAHAEAIERIAEEIDGNPSAAYRVETLAKETGLSADHFTRLFRSQKGVTPREFILRARIESAQGLLRSSSHSIGRIAEILGYSDVYFFSRQFKEKVGVSPSEYRNR